MDLSECILKISELERKALLSVASRNKILAGHFIQCLSYVQRGIEFRGDSVNGLSFILK